jgi:hypothetical protein
MASDEAFRRLAKLSERQREILTLRCQGKLYKEIAEHLHLSESTIKTNMTRVYEKLGLDEMPDNLRPKVINEVYCPALSSRALVVIPYAEDDTDAELRPVKDKVLRKVEADDTLLILYQRRHTPAVVVPPPPRDDLEIVDGEFRPVPQTRRGVWMVGGIAIGAVVGVLALVGAFFIYQTLFAATPTPVAQATALPTNTPDVQPSSTPQVITVIVTATAPPVTETSVPTETIVPTATATITPAPKPTDTLPGTVLGVGDYWIQNDVALAIVKYTLSPGSSLQNIGISFNLDNLTGADLLVSVNKSDIIVTTGSGTALEIWDWMNCLIQAVLLPPAGSLNFTCRGPATLGVIADLRDPSISEIHVRVISFTSRIRDARFRFTIER